MGKPEKKIGGQKISKTALTSLGQRGGAGRGIVCPQHERRLVPCILVAPTGRPRDGWICGARGIGNVESDAATHYLTRDMEAWIP